MTGKKKRKNSDHGNIRRLMSGYIASTIIILCAAALVFGAVTAAERTKTIAFGEQAVAAAASPVEKLGESTVKMPDFIRQMDFSPLARSVPVLFGPVFSNFAYGVQEATALMQNS